MLIIPKSAANLYLTPAPQDPLAIVLVTDERGAVYHRDTGAFQVALDDFLTTVYLTVTAEDRQTSTSHLIKIVKQEELSGDTSIMRIYCNYYDSTDDSGHEIVLDPSKRKYTVKVPKNIVGYMFAVQPTSYMSKVVYLVEGQEYEFLDFINNKAIEALITAENGNSQIYSSQFIKENNPPWLDAVMISLGLAFLIIMAKFKKLRSDTN